MESQKLNQSQITDNTDTSKSIRDGEERNMGKCGLGPLEPKCLQSCNDPKAYLLVFCCFTFVQSMIVSGFVVISITSLEIRFNFNSVYGGTIVAFYDIACLLFMVPITYYGGHGHKPRYLGLGCILMGIGSFIFALPHFLTGLYEYSGVSENTCITGNTTINGDKEANHQQHINTNLYFGIFIIAQILIGIGATPLYTLGTAYLDENVRPKHLPIYLGIFLSVAVLGPAIGYVVGGIFLGFWTDIDKVSQSNITIGVESSLWVGCWWLGFLISGLLALITAIPLLSFPRRLSGWKRVEEEKTVQTHQNKHTEKATKAGFGQNTKDLPASLKSLLANPPLVCVCLALGFKAGVVAGLATFGPKYLEHQFQLSKSDAAIIAGLVTVPASLVGNLSGGILMKKMKLTLRGTLKLCIISIALALVMVVPCFYLQCGSLSFAGVNVPYAPDGNSSNIELANECNSNCSCSSEYDPVCGSDKVTYFSPCYAGCINDSRHDQVYMQCSCVLETEMLATSGACSGSCPELIYLLIIMFFFITFAFLPSAPSTNIVMRTVAESQKSFALGLNSFINRCVGSIPAPIIFGRAIDSSCLFWNEDWQDIDASSCLFYDNNKLCTYYFSLCLAYVFIELVFYCMALCLYKPPNENLADKTAQKFVYSTLDQEDMGNNNKF